MMLIFDSTKCVGCGACAADCFPGALVMQDNLPSLLHPDYCLSCGHCIAICPVQAVSESDAAENEIVPCSYLSDPGALLLHMRSRRSCRHYKAMPVPTETLTMLMDAARACPTAKNLQDLRFISVTENIDALLNAALEALGHVGHAQLKTASDPNELRRAQNFISWSQKRRSDSSFDPLFFHAPQLLLFVAHQDTARDAAAAAAYAELMAAACGLGCLYSGYFTACASGSAEIRSILQLADDEQVVRCLVLGYPDIRFRRTPPRKKANCTEL